MKNQMNKQKGFTLIELIIVIVILGILAVTAAPRFIDLQSDAKASTLKGVKAALQGASQLVYARAAIDGKLNGTLAAPESVTLASGSVSTVNGYPNAATITSVALINTFVDLDSEDFTVIADTTSNQFLISLGDTSALDFAETETAGCLVSYTNAAANSSPTIVVDSDDC